MRRILETALAFAALMAITWMAIAMQWVAHGACAGPTVALVKPFGGAVAVTVQRSAR
ncbi:MAG TPA: hypothetical protein VGF50_01590 [Caulobacteraceae bacterium]|jgi:hypothetical protein